MLDLMLTRGAEPVYAIVLAFALTQQGQFILSGSSCVLENTFHHVFDHENFTSVNYLHIPRLYW